MPERRASKRAARRSLAEKPATHSVYASKPSPLSRSAERPSTAAFTSKPDAEDSSRTRSARLQKLGDKAIYRETMVVVDLG